MIFIYSYSCLYRIILKLPGTTKELGGEWGRRGAGCGCWVGGWFPFITGGRGSNLFQLLRGNTKAAFSNIYWQLHRILALLVQR